MERGTVVGGRFRVEGRQAAGGMGEIHLAVDLETSAHVALKVLRWQSDSIEARFVREATVLAELSHPGIVRYVAHGRASADEGAYLAMEWIEGESLAERLKRGPLSVADTLTLGSRMAEALAVAHARTIIHRDLKPGNLLLEHGDVGHVKILDFGLARNAAASLLVLTRTGELAGTPGYMAPEQARGLHDVNPRADVYSFGCVLFECLAGRPAFSGEHVYAVLAKILVEEPPRISELRPDVPLALDDLLFRMLSKDPADRPADAAEVQAELYRISPSDTPASAAPGRGLGRTEQKVLCVVLAAGDVVDLDGESAPTISDHERSATDLELEAIVASFRGSLERLAGGSLVITFGGAGSATDLATRAARCALAVSSLLSDMQVAVATGRGLAHEHIPVGAAIDQAARLIARGGELGSGSEPSSTPSAPRPPLSPWMPVRLDETTANLLDPRFEIGVDHGLHLLLGFTEYREADRTLLGRLTQFVGRDRELGNLVGTYEECCNEPMAQAVLVTAPAGAGKSRLRQELLRRLTRDSGPMQVWIGRGDPMSAGAPLSLLSQMIRREAGFVHGESMRLWRRKLRARVSRHVPAIEADRVTVFLGEMCGVPFSDERRPVLRTARSDAGVMGDQMRRAWEDLLTGETQAGPLLLVLEDLHWGDLPTVKFVDGGLRVLARRPLLVLALARPEIHELFPELWANRVLQVVNLRPLAERAARKLVEQVLGDAAAEEQIRRIVDQAAGNAFYLEELIRAASLGQDNPGTVLVMIGARLETLPGEQRRLLRAASVLGESFWPDALSSLLGRDPTWIAHSLAQLVEGEWLATRSEASRGGPREYAFRHALVREAAYAMLTDEDRRLGHRLAAEWLEQTRQPDAMTVGEHFERSGEVARAAVWYGRAAKQALEGTDLRAAVDRARRGLACAAAAAEPLPAQELGRLRVTLAEAYTWLGDNVEAEADGVAALDMLPRFTTPWYAAASQVALAAGRLGHLDRVLALGEALRGAEVDPASAAGWLHAALPTAQMLIYAGRHFDVVDALLGRVDALLPAATAIDPSLPGQASMVLGVRLGAAGDLEGGIDSVAQGAQLLERVGHRRRAAVAHHDLGSDYLRLGAWKRAEAELRTALAEGEQIGMPRLEAVAAQNLGFAVAFGGDPAEGARLIRGALASLGSRPDSRLEAGSREYLARVLLLLGDPAGAEAEARQVVAMVAGRSTPRVHALGVLAATLLAQGRAAEAVAATREAMQIRDELGEVEGDAQVRLAHAEALRAIGDDAAARVAIAAARDRVQRLAVQIRDPALRAMFLDDVPENACILRLAAEWLGAA